jgi:hypothetical protein
MNSWEETMAELIKLGIELQPQAGQVWTLREDSTIRRLLDPEDKLPEKVMVSGVDPPGWSKFTIKVRVVSYDTEMEIDCFGTLYELHRPSVWERITQRT